MEYEKFVNVLQAASKYITSSLIKENNNLSASDATIMAQKMLQVIIMESANLSESMENNDGDGDVQILPGKSSFDIDNEKLNYSENDLQIITYLNCGKPYSTLLRHPSYNNGKTMLVDFTDDKDVASHQHELWLNKILVPHSDLPEIIEDLTPRIQKLENRIPTMNYAKSCIPYIPNEIKRLLIKKDLAERQENFELASQLKEKLNKLQLEEIKKIMT